MSTDRWAAIEWQSEDRFALDGVKFWMTTTEYHVPSTPEQFVLLKNRDFLNSYRRLFEQVKPAKIFEVGFFHGASAALYDLLLSPDKIVCIDQVPEAPALDHYIRMRGRSSIAPHFGINQNDKTAIQEILEQEFPARDIDLIIDDASHEYSAARATFEAAFPYLGDGGVYLVEDWGWAHWPGAWQDCAKPIIPGPALSNLVFEFVMIQASRPDLVRSLCIDRYFAALFRGPGSLGDAPLQIGDLYLTRGKQLSLL